MENKSPKALAITKIQRNNFIRNLFLTKVIGAYEMRIQLWLSASVPVKFECLKG